MTRGSARAPAARRAAGGRGGTVAVVPDKAAALPHPTHADSAAAPLDTESRTSPDDHQALRLWLRLLACVNLVEAPLRRRLHAEFGVSLPRFDLLAQLDRHPGGLRMRELSRRLMVTGGNVTGLTDKLVAEGLVERLHNPHDGRATTVRLTAAGQRQFDAMAQAHERWVAELFAGIDARQQLQLFELLGALKHSRAAAAV